MVKEYVEDTPEPLAVNVVFQPTKVYPEFAYCVMVAVFVLTVVNSPVPFVCETDEDDDVHHAAVYRLDQHQLPLWSGPLLGNDERGTDCPAVVDVSW